MATLHGVRAIPHNLWVTVPKDLDTNDTRAEARCKHHTGKEMRRYAPLSSGTWFKLALIQGTVMATLTLPFLIDRYYYGNDDGYLQHTYTTLGKGTLACLGTVFIKQVRGL
jgi:hypothetical protein